MTRHLPGAALMLLVVALVGPAGCSAAGATSCGGNGTGKITFATVKDLSKQQRTDLISSWHRVSDDPLEIVVLPATSDQQRAQLAATLQIDQRSGSGRRDGYDVVGLDTIFLPEFAKGGYLQPLSADRFSDAGFLDVPWHSSFYDHQLWAVPFTTNVGLLYYWADELVRLGVIADKNQRWNPKDWQSVAKVARDSRDDSLPGPSGYAGQLAQYEGLTANTLELIWAERGDLPTPTSPVDEEGLKAAAEGVGFLLDGVRNRWIDQAVLGFDERASLNAFQQRKALVMRHWPDAWPTLAQDSDNIRVTALPGRHSTVLGGESLAVARCSPNRASAMAFISFLTQVGQQRWIFRNGLYLPTVQSLYEDGSLVDTGPQKLSADFVALLHASIDNARARPAEPAYNRASHLIQTHVHSALERSTDSTIDAKDTVVKLAADLAR